MKTEHCRFIGLDGTDDRLPEDADNSSQRGWGQMTEATKNVWAYSMAHKADVFNVLQKWLALVENQLSGKPKCLKINNGGLSPMSFIIYVIHVA